MAERQHQQNLEATSSSRELQTFGRVYLTNLGVDKTIIGAVCSRVGVLQKLHYSKEHPEHAEKFEKQLQATLKNLSPEQRDQAKKHGDEIFALFQNREQTPQEYQPKLYTRRPIGKVEKVTLNTDDINPELLEQTQRDYWKKPALDIFKQKMGPENFLKFQSLVHILLHGGEVTREDCGRSIDILSVRRHAQKIKEFARDGLSSL